ncbi:MAG: hypothetical protein ACOX8N_08450 [Christensenellales bacterium]|jgi:hypothetical protein
MNTRFPLFIVFCIICMLLCSCIASSEGELPDTGASDTEVSDLHTESSQVFDIKLDINRGIFDLSSCLPGFASTFGCNYFTYKLKDLHLSLFVYDKRKPIEDIQPGIDSFDRRTEYGIDYYFRSDTIFWDGIDEETGEETGGETTTAYAVFYIDDYIVTLTGSTENEDVSAVKLQLALDLLSDKPMDGLERLGGGLSARLYNGILECNISLIPKDNAEYQHIFNASDAIIKQEGSIRYLASIPERSLDDPNARFVVCDTDKGALLVSCGVPYSERNNVLDEALDFVNLSLAQNIAEGLGIVITSISK